MRLIDTSTLALREFSGRSPPYAILSHTWGADGEEVSLQEMLTPDRSKETTSKPGYSKIVKTCEIARNIHNLAWAWVDTCCIDKMSSADLSEAINSMFKWYQRSEICIAFLSDIASDNPSIAKSRWFTRGWTLQELIAPSQVTFFDQTWRRRGTKRDLSEQLNAITRIPEDVLKRPEGDLNKIPVAARMSWASVRQTTREEDLAYSLMGLFDVNMPMLYGEGSKAFLRLQEEIIKQNSDLSIFAWQDPGSKEQFAGLLAISPMAFHGFGEIVQGPELSLKHQDFTITNRGMRLHLPLGREEETGLSVFPTGHRFPKVGSSRNSDIGIFLRQVERDLFVRAWPSRIVSWIRCFVDMTFYVPKTLTSDQIENTGCTFLRVLPLGNIDHANHKPMEVWPLFSWDPSCSHLYAGHTSSFLGFMRFSLSARSTNDYFVIVCCYNVEDHWQCTLVEGEEWAKGGGYVYWFWRENSDRMVGVGAEQSIIVEFGAHQHDPKKVVMKLEPSGDPRSANLRWGVEDMPSADSSVSTTPDVASSSFP